VSRQHGPSLFGWNRRNGFQLGVLIITLTIGIQFFIHVHQAGGNGSIAVSRPPGVEGFLPIGALMGWKLLLTTGRWDPVHPAAMVILGFAAVISFALRKSFCAWFCPVGTLSEWLWRSGRQMMGKNFLPPLWIDVPLRGIKYLLLSFFIWIIFSMSPPAILDFLKSPYYQLSDVKMLFFFTRMPLLTAMVLTGLVIGSFIIRNFWCRYLCPYGALMGLLAMIGPTGIVRTHETCINCGRCARVCPASLPVERKERLLSPECSGCMDCVGICPVPGTLRLSTTGRGWTATALGITILMIFAGSVLSARITGHWQGQITERQFRLLLLSIDSPELTHPGLEKK
jgi:polyferredoxin